MRTKQTATKKDVNSKKGNTKKMSAMRKNAPAEGGIKKIGRRWKAGTVALREIKKY